MAVWGVEIAMWEFVDAEPQNRHMGPRDQGIAICTNLISAVTAVALLRLLFMLVEVEKVGGVDFEGFREPEDVVEADVLLAALDRAHEVAVRLDHRAEILLGDAPRHAEGTQAFAER